MTTLWCELAWTGGETAERGVTIEVDGDRIANVMCTASPPDDAERLPGLTLPGLANAHSHAFQRGLRGRTQAGAGTFWTWRKQMYALGERLDPDSYLALARATFAEMALAGITLVGEFHYVHHQPGGTPYDDPNAMGASIIQAARDAGMRLTLLDTCYLHGGIDAGLEPAQQRFSDGDAHAWRERAEALAAADDVRIGAAIHSVRAVDPESATLVAEWANARGAPLHAHVSEQVVENEQCAAAYGMTPTALLESTGALTERFTAVHATHVTDDDLRLLGSAAVTCCLCPTTERDLADGIGDASRMREAGARLAVGSDSQAVIDLLEEARAIELDERLATGRRGNHGVAELLGAATADGYRSLGWDEGGKLASGMLADLVTVSLDSVRLAGTPPLEGAVYAATAADVRDVMVGGRWIVRAGRHLAIDAAAELRGELGA